jgi:hypothetical protein
MYAKDQSISPSTRLLIMKIILLQFLHPIVTNLVSGQNNSLRSVPNYSQCIFLSSGLRNRVLHPEKTNNWFLVKIWGFHGGAYEECRLLGCYAVWLLYLAHRIFPTWWWRRYIPQERRFLQDPDGVTSQKTAFFLTNYLFSDHGIPDCRERIQMLSESASKWPFTCRLVVSVARAQAVMRFNRGVYILIKSY